MKPLLVWIFACLGTLTCFAQKNLTLLSNLPFPGRTCAGVQAYMDSTGKEYALVGTSTAVAIVDISDPASPVVKFEVPVKPSLWQELAVYKKYAYSVTEGGGGVTIIDLGQLPDTVTHTIWTGDSTVAGLVNRAHTVGAYGDYLYLFGTAGLANGGAVVASLADPLNPHYAGEYTPRYIHDGYVRNDTLYAGEIYNGQFSVVDFTNKSNPVVLASKATPGAFNHNTWLSDNGRFLFTTDERSNTPLGSFDISNISDIKLVDTYFTLKMPSREVHNVRVLNDFLVNSCYGSQVTIVDAARPHNLVEVADFPVGTGLCWDAIPFLPSGNIIATDKDNGLFVFAPSYIRACYLEGTVTDSLTLQPIMDAKVEVLNTAMLEKTALNGQYKTGQADSGIFSVRFSKLGYYAKTVDSVMLKNGVLTTLDVQLKPVKKFAVTGKVIVKNNGSAVAGAKVRLANEYFSKELSTDGTGNFIDSTNYVGPYSFHAGKWNFRTSCVDSLFIDTLTGPVTLEIDSGIYDDFTFDYGWAVTGNALSGAWERGEPRGTTFSSLQANPEYDSNNDCFENCYVTGNGGGLPEDDDVNDGTTILTSPVFDPSSLKDPYIRYQRWFYNRGGNLPFDDTLVVKLSDGSSTVILEKVAGGSITLSKWNQQNFRIADYLVPTSTMQLIFEIADDTAANHIVESAVDVFEVVDSSFLGTEKISSSPSLRIYPNPAQNEIWITLPVYPHEGASVQILGITGALLTEQTVKDLRLHLRTEDFPPGIYFVRYVSKELYLAEKMVITK